MTQDLVSIIIPALNESLAIETVVRGLRDRLPRCEIIVVDDGSVDNTARLASNAGARVISHDSPRGYGAALTTGIHAAGRDYVLFCDGDGQHSVDDVETLIREIDGCDMVVGERGRDSHRPWLRRPGKFILQSVVDYLAGQKIPDVNSGLRIFRKEVLMKYIHLMPEGFSFSTTSTFAMLKTKRKFKFVPIKAGARIGKSTVNPLRHGIETIMLVLRLAVLFEPLKVFLTVAGALFLPAMASLARDVFWAGNITDTTVTLSIATLIVFMFGLLCDQVSALRREIHEK